MSGMYFTPLKRVFLNLSGGTVTGNTFFTQGVSANTVSANTLFISSLPANRVLYTNSSSAITGSNLYMNDSGGVYAFDVATYSQLGGFGTMSYLNFAAANARITHTNGSIYWTADGIELASTKVRTQNFSASSISGNTLYSGSTNLYDIFAGIGTGGGGSTFIQPTQVAFGSSISALTSDSEFYYIKQSLGGGYLKLGYDTLGLRLGTLSNGSPFQNFVLSQYFLTVGGRSGEQNIYFDYDNRNIKHTSTSGHYFTNASHNFIFTKWVGVADSYPTIYMFADTATTVSNNNYAIANDGSNLYLNANGNGGNIRVDNKGVAQLFVGAMAATVGGIQTAQDTLGLYGKNSTSKIFLNDIGGGDSNINHYATQGHQFNQSNVILNSVALDFGTNINGPTRIEKGGSHMYLSTTNDGLFGNFIFRPNYTESVRIAPDGIKTSGITANTFVIDTIAGVWGFDYFNSGIKRWSFNVDGNNYFRIHPWLGGAYGSGDIFFEGSAIGVGGVPTENLSVYGKTRTHTLTATTITATTIWAKNNSFSLNGNGPIMVNDNGDSDATRTWSVGYSDQTKFKIYNSSEFVIEGYNGASYFPLSIRTSSVDIYGFQVVRGNLCVGTSIFQQPTNALEVVGTATTYTLSATTLSASTIQSESLIGYGDRMVQANEVGNLSAYQEIVSGIVTDPAAIALLTNFSNWDASGVYTGATIKNTYQGQFYGDTGNTYIYLALADNYFARIPRV